MHRRFSNHRTMDTLELVTNRLQVLVGAKIKRKDKTITAMKIQDELRNKHSNIKRGWTGVDEIRKWRDKR